MADETIDQGQSAANANPEIEAEARRSGWRPKDQWRGPAEQWVDATQFVENGRKVLPHVQRQAAALRQENEALKAQQARQAQELEEMKGQVAGLTTFQGEMTKRERARIREELILELADARQNNNPVAEARVLAKLSEPEPAPVAPIRSPGAGANAAAANGHNGSGNGAGNASGGTLPPELQQWVGANEWYQRDPVLQQAMTVVGAEMRTSGHFYPGMTLTEQLNETAREVLKRYAPPGAHVGRVEGGRSSGEGGGARNQSDPNSWEALPANIKQEGEALGNRLGLIGKGKAFPDINAYRAHYAREYNRYAPGTGYDFRPPGN